MLKIYLCIKTVFCPFITWYQFGNILSFSAFVFEAPKIEHTHFMEGMWWHSKFIVVQFGNIFLRLRFRDSRTCLTHSLLLYIDRFKIKCIYNIFFQHLNIFFQIPDLKKETQTKLDDYFSDPFGDEDNEDLLKVMDEIDGVQEKKIKLDS